MLLDLQAAGTIYYTVDGSVPTLSSQTFSGLASVPVSCTVRALAAEPGALPSRVLTLNYFIGEPSVPLPQSRGLCPAGC